jgi:hypothetical protein
MSMTIPGSAARRRAIRWARAALIVAGVLTAWAILVAITGGIRYELGPLRISSRNPVRPALVALLLAALAWRLGYEAWLDARVRSLAGSATAIQRALVVAAAAGLLAIGIVYGVRAAGGSDSQGYVSQSALWRQGHVKLDHRFPAAMPWPDAPGTFAPLGYRTLDGLELVPTYSPGLPVLMAASRLVSWSGPYLIGSLSGALLVVCTYLLGRKYLSAGLGAVAAVLTAASPTVLFMSMNPMADVPAAAFWLAALAAAGPSGGRAALAGVLAGTAIAIRPNLVPLALFPWLLCVMRSSAVPSIVNRTAAFGTSVLPGIALVMWTNNHLYGSPLESGYGPLGGAFELGHFGANLARYPAWWLESQGVLGFAFAAGVIRRHPRHQREVAVLVAFAAAVVLLYLFYIPFDAWWFLRFLVPAIPIALLFCVNAVEWAAARLPPAPRCAALVAFACLMLGHAVTFNRQIAVLDTGDGEQKYVDAGVYVDRVTPPGSVILSMQHSGSIRYYSGRLTLRYDALEPGWLDRAIETLESHGRPVYLLIDEWEEPDVRKRFAGQRAMLKLETPAATGRAGKLRFYALGNAPFNEASPRIPRISRFEPHDVSPGFSTAGAPAGR